MEKLGAKHYILGLQHLFAMFGATVLVPAITGMNPAIALISAGIGTLLFHMLTNYQVPVFLGSSFAFIAVIKGVLDPNFLSNAGNAAYNYSPNMANMPMLQGGIIVAGLVYVVLSAVIYFIGVDKIKKLFPPVVTAPVIIVIGLTLSPVAIGSASTCWPIAIIVIAAIVITMCFTKGFFKLVPILIGLVTGYLVTLIFDLTGITSMFGMVNAQGQAITNLIDFSAIANANWFIQFDKFTVPSFNLFAITLVAPIALVTFMEHIGDITTNGMVVGKNFLDKPGLHRTLLGDGLATALVGLLGGPANTTYSENTGVLAVTKMYDPRVIRIAAVYAIILGLFGKFGAILQTIPAPVMGGISIILFGMIASIGLRSLSDAKLDFSHSRNLIIVALVLVFGLGLKEVPLKWMFDLFGAGNSTIANSLSLSGLFVAMLIGVIANAILPENL